MNGFTPYATGCPVIIADGLKGTDEVRWFRWTASMSKRQRVGRALMDADILISLTHFKGHEVNRFRRCLSKISVWAADPGQEKWSSTAPASHM